MRNIKLFNIKTENGVEKFEIFLQDDLTTTSQKISGFDAQRSSVNDVRELPSFYSILQLNINDNKEVITARYRKLAPLFHPDKNPNDAQAAAAFNIVNTAYTTLTNIDNKKAYDNFLRTMEQRGAAQGATATEAEEEQLKAAEANAAKRAEYTAMAAAQRDLQRAYEGKQAAKTARENYNNNKDDIDACAKHMAYIISNKTEFNNLFGIFASGTRKIDLLRTVHLMLRDTRLDNEDLKTLIAASLMVGDPLTFQRIFFNDPKIGTKNPDGRDYVTQSLATNNNAIAARQLIFSPTFGTGSTSDLADDLRGRGIAYLANFLTPETVLHIQDPTQTFRYYYSQLQSTAGINATTVLLNAIPLVATQEAANFLRVSQYQGNLATNQQLLMAIAMAANSSGCFLAKIQTKYLLNESVLAQITTNIALKDDLLTAMVKNVNQLKAETSQPAPDKQAFYKAIVAFCLDPLFPEQQRFENTKAALLAAQDISVDLSTPIFNSIANPSSTMLYNQVVHLNNACLLGDAAVKEAATTQAINFFKDVLTNPKYNMKTKDMPCNGKVLEAIVTRQTNEELLKAVAAHCNYGVNVAEKIKAGISAGPQSTKSDLSSTTRSTVIARQQETDAPARTRKKLEIATDTAGSKKLATIQTFIVDEAKAYIESRKKGDPLIKESALKLERNKICFFPLRDEATTNAKLKCARNLIDMVLRAKTPAQCLAALGWSSQDNYKATGTFRSLGDFDVMLKHCEKELRKNLPELKGKDMVELMNKTHLLRDKTLTQEGQRSPNVQPRR